MSVYVRVERADLAGHEIEFIVTNTLDQPGDPPQRYEAIPVTGDAGPGSFSAQVGVPRQEGGEITVVAHVIDGGASDCTSESHPVVFKSGSNVTTSTTAPPSGA